MLYLKGNYQLRNRFEVKPQTWFKFTSNKMSTVHYYNKRLNDRVATVMNCHEKVVNFENFSEIHENVMNFLDAGIK